MAATFDWDVTVAGTPELNIEVGGSSRAALYQPALSDAAVIVFSYTVQAGDQDTDGVSVYPGSIVLPQGASIRDAQGKDADLTLAAGLAPQPGHTVDGSLPPQQTQQQQAANNEPEFALDGDTRSVAENAAVGANVGGPVTATDADNDALTYVLTGSGAFAIDASTGQITLQEALDYETQNSYALTVSVSDGKDASGGADADSGVDDTIAVTVNVGNVDEAGTVSFDADPPRAGSLLTASLNDPDRGVSGVTWTWEVSADGTSWSSIDGVSGASYTPSNDDVGSRLRATAGYADGQGPGKSAAAAARVQAAPTVPADSPLVPGGVGPGDSFRLLFVTSATTRVESADIADYNAHVQTAAGNNSSLADFSGQFRALISTSAVDAKTNTATAGTGVPVHWLGGEKVADDYSDLYDGSWDSVSGKTESGSGYTGLVWTGGNKQGEKSGQSYAGAAEVRLGDLSDATLALSSPMARAATESYPLYALSPVITVAARQQQAANNEPQFALDSDTRSVDENAAVGANVGAPVTAGDDDGDVLTYALNGSGAFAIDPGTGQITVQGALDYETKSSYALTVAVTDGKNLSGGADSGVDDTIAVTVSVGNVDEAGTVSFDADPPRGGSPLTATLSDPDRGVSGETWTWEVSADGTNWSVIDGVIGASYTPSNDDVGSHLRATASYADGQGPGKSAAAATASAVEAAAQPQPEPPANDAPAIVAGPVITSIPASGDTYGKGEAIVVAVVYSEAVTVRGEPRVRLTVGERQRWARYDLSSEDGTILVFAYEVKGNDRDGDGVSIPENAPGLNRGTIEDGDGNAADLSAPALPDQAGHKVDGSLEPQPAQQQQQAANSEPRFALDGDARSVDENAAVGSNVGAPVTARDDDGDALTYALTGSGTFAINASTGQITVREALDHETKSSYALTVAVTDGKNPSGGADIGVDDTMVITVNVGNVDEAGTVSFNAVPPRAGSLLTASLNDPDGGVSGETWTWEVSADGTNWTAINGVTGASYTPSDDDVGSYLRATASYADGQGPGKSAAAATASAVEAAQGQAAPTVPADSPLVPDGIEPGGSFRLLFVTSTTTKAETADIAGYNSFVQGRAAANTNLASFSGQFTAYISTATVDARDNTATSGTGVSIHWLGGERVADDYADLHDGDWDSVSGRTEGGSSYTGLVWTGGNKQGGKSGQRHAGAAEVRMGDLSDATLPLSSPTAKASTEAYPLYALSPVITVAQPE